MNNFKEKFIGFVKARGVGFWLLLPATVFSIVLTFVYLSAYVSQPSYFEAGVMIIPFFAAAAFAMCFFKYTDKYAGVVTFVFSLLFLLMFINTVYYDVTDKLFKAGDISLGGIFKYMGSDFLFIVFASFINIVLAIVASFFAQRRKTEVKTSESTEREAVS